MGHWPKNVKARDQKVMNPLEQGVINQPNRLWAITDKAIG